MAVLWGAFGAGPLWDRLNCCQIDAFAPEIRDSILTKPDKNDNLKLS